MIKKAFPKTHCAPIKTVLLILLISSLPSKLVAQKKVVFTATIEGNVAVSINKKPAKQYHEGNTISIQPVSKICHQSGKGKIYIKFGRFSEVLSKGDCLPIAKQTKDGGFLEELWAFLGNKGESIVAGNARGTEEEADSKTKTNNKKQEVKKKDEIISFQPYVINNKKHLFIRRNAHLNQRTLPVRLEMITADNKRKTLQKYHKSGDGGVYFMIPWQEIEDKNNPVQSYALRIVTRTGIELLKATRFRLEVNVVK